MKKQEFLEKLKGSLWAMPEGDIRNSLDYYSEMIDDRMEDGLTEDEAVAAIGDLDEIVSQILSETPRPPQVVEPGKKTKPTKDSTKTWLIILLILGSPVWIPLLASAIGTVMGIYVSLWSAVIVLYAGFLALAVSSAGCIVGSFFMFGGITGGIVAWGAALVCAGLAILLLLLANLAAKGMVKLTKLVWNSIFCRKERVV
jgi:uncharacterized membrane protein